ncbi:dihydrofolate reductase [Nocardioides humilatus]|uniref:Dihydrofolate reductase n=1 Tax=Nocardioides humilatus TaxID=2607660 RepID=A0A5B1LHW7_9ACTN|nr:dihydrofolate reductase family protein [Nocardioides humilatus]KAA1419239.1 dihydrofolate reductase [Nocardioides humilatus]
MTRLIYYTATTLDGFIADPDDSLDWLMRQDQDEKGPLNYEDFIKDIGAIVMGATTYEWVRRHEPDQWFYSMPAWVMTHRDLAAPAIEGVKADVRFASGDVQEVYDLMVAAADGKDLWVVGGGDLVGQFADAGLLDEVITYIAPVTLGAGRPILPRRYDLELIEATQNKAFIAARYRFVGPLKEDGAAAG